MNGESQLPSLTVYNPAVVPDASHVPAAPPPEAFARLFESVHEGVYIGILSSDTSRTLSANPYLKLMFGFAPETAQEEVRPFEQDRFVDPLARHGYGWK
jgi:hypothetical protein